MEEALALVLPPTSRGTAPGWGVPPLLGTPGFRLLPSQLASTFHHYIKTNGISADGGKQGEAPSCREHLPYPASPAFICPQGMGTGEKPFSGQFPATFSFPV